jgi:hypothetical protein
MDSLREAHQDNSNSYPLDTFRTTAAAEATTLPKDNRITKDS